MTKAKLTLRLPKKEIEFLKQYSQKHGVSVTSLITQYCEMLHPKDESPLDSRIDEIRGLIPLPDKNKKGPSEYFDYLEKKHG